MTFFPQHKELVIKVFFFDNTIQGSSLISLYGSVASFTGHCVQGLEVH